MKSVWNDTVFATLKPVWFLSALFGMRTPPDRRFSLPYVLLTLSTVCFLVYGTTEFNTVPNIKIITQLADFLFTFGNNIMLVVAITCRLVNGKELTKFVKRIREIDEQLHPKYWPVKVFVLYELGFTFTTWIAFFFYYVVMQCTNTKSECFRSWFVKYTSTKVGQVLVVEFCVYVLILKQKFEIINKHLLNKSNSFDQLRKLHGDVVTACHQVESIFALPLLTKTASQFVGIFSSLYFCIFGYMYDNQLVKPKNFNDLTIPFISVIISTAELLTTVTVCELAVIEFENAGRVIYAAPVNRRNVQMLKKIKLMSLQMIHADLGFSAYGFFKINGALLRTIAGAVTVYLFMFIQFDLGTNNHTQL